jgi:hypothetical protein
MQMLKRSCAALFTVLVLAIPSWSQCCTALNFPLRMEPEDRATTGIAIVNPSPEDAVFTFSMYNPVGALLNSTERTVPAGGQLALLVSELFPGVGGSAVWIQANALGTDYASFWLGGNFATHIDGANVPDEIRNHLLPVTGAATEIHVVNPTVAGLTFTAQAFDANGTALAPPRTFGMEEKQTTLLTVQMLAPSVDVSLATHVRIASQRDISAAAVIPDYLVSPAWGVANSIDADVFVPSLHFPHVVSGPLDGTRYETQVSVTNLSYSPQPVTLTFHADDGPPAIVQTQIPGNGTLRESAESLFGLQAGVFHGGWVHVEGDSGLTGFVAYAELTRQGMAISPGDMQSATEVVFAHIADLDPWWTGIALLNATGTEASVEVYAMTPSGDLIGGADNVSTATLTVAPGQRAVKLLSQLIPQTQDRTSDGGFVYVRSNVPIFGTQLFFTRDLKLLANVPGHALAPETAYTPPVP